MENEKLTYINSRGERLELGVDSVYHCNISKDVEGISGVTSVIYSTNSMGQHGDTYVGQRIEARDIDVVGHINTRDKDRGRGREYRELDKRIPTQNTWLPFSGGIIQGRGKAACITTDTGSVRGWQQWQPYYCAA